MHTPQDLTQAIAKVTDGDIPPDEIPNLRRVGALPLPWQAVCEPIGLAGNIIKDLGKSETFEPSRSPGAEVSLRVIAVDNDWLVRLERSSGLAIELLQRDIYRPG